MEILLALAGAFFFALGTVLQQKGAVAEPEPERRETGILYRHSMQLVASCGLSSVAIGAAQAMLDAFSPLARRKTPSNSGALRDDNWVQTRIAQADAKISSARAWLEQLLHRAWEECATSGAVSFPLRIKLRQACTHQIDSAREKKGPGDLNALFASGETWTVA